MDFSDYVFGLYMEEAVKPANHWLILDKKKDYSMRVFGLSAQLIRICMLR